MAFQGCISAESIICPAGLGRTQPFIIKADNGNNYVVKGFMGAGGKQLASELICAELGSRCGLPIPDYAIMNIPSELIDYSIGYEEKLYSLKGGPAFASLQIEHAREFQFSQIIDVPEILQQRLLIFDYWISNGDRVLSPLGGNVNLLMDPNDNLVVIDHNLALIEEPCLENIHNHVFSGQIVSLQDLMVRAVHESALDSALSEWDTIIHKVPEEWLYRDCLEHDDPFHPTLDTQYQNLLRLCDDIWREI